MTPSLRTLILAIVTVSLFMSAVAIDSASSAFAANALVRNSSDLNIMSRLQKLRQLVQVNGCRANVCFVLQGDNSISSEDFNNQKSFVDLIANIITTDDNSGLCAVQYSRSTRLISSLTYNRTMFFDKLYAAKKVGGSYAHFAIALHYARFQLWQRKDANKIVLLTNLFDSQRPLGINAPPVSSFCNVPICLVSVGHFFSITSNFAPSRICPLPNLLPVNDFFHLLEIIDALVSDICSI